MAEVMVKGNQIQDATIQTADLANGAVTGAKIAANQTITGLQVNNGLGVNYTPSPSSALSIAPHPSGSNTAIATTGVYTNGAGGAGAAVCGLNNQASAAAANNNDFCYGIYNAPGLIANGKTGLTGVGAQFVGMVAPTGFVNNYVVRIGAPSGATNNYSLVVDGATSLGAGLTVVGNITFGQNTNLLTWPSGSYIQLNGSTLVLQAATTSMNAATVTSISSSGTIRLTGDYFRISGSGNGIYNDNTAAGLMFPAAGPTDYASGQVLLRQGNFNAQIPDGYISHMWTFTLAPAGSTSSGSAVYMPGQLGSGMACSGYQGGKVIIIANLALIQSNVGSGMTISVYINGQDANNRVQINSCSAANGAQTVPFIYSYGPGIYSGFSIAFAWSLQGAGSISVNTGIYSNVTVIEHIK